MASYLVDHTIFGGIISESERRHFDISFLHSAADTTSPFSLTFIAEYIDLIPFLLSVSFCGVVAAETNDSKIINIGVFLLSFCVLNCFILLLIGNAEPSFWMKHFHVGSILIVFKEANAVMSSVYALMYFGEEAVHPSKDLPPAMLWSYFITWGWYAVFPALLWLNGRDLSFNSPTLFSEILKNKGFEGVSFLPPLGITCAVYSSCFVELFVTIQLFLAMTRDHLLPKVFGKVEHFNRMPVKPTFLVGVIIALPRFSLDGDFGQLPMIQAVKNYHVAVATATRSFEGVPTLTAKLLQDLREASGNEDGISNLSILKDKLRQQYEILRRAKSCAGHNRQTTTFTNRETSHQDLEFAGWQCFGK